MSDCAAFLEMENPAALAKFIGLMLAVTRIINAVVLTYKGDQTLHASRSFLAENKPSLNGVFKRFIGVGGGHNGDENNDKNLEDLVDNLTLLISASGFLEVSGVDC